MPTTTVHSKNTPPGLEASWASAPLWSAEPLPAPIATVIAIDPIRMCSSPLTANPSRASSCSAELLLASRAMCVAGEFITGSA